MDGNDGAWPESWPDRWRQPRKQFSARMKEAARLEGQGSLDHAIAALREALIANEGMRGCGIAGIVRLQQEICARRYLSHLLRKRERVREARVELERAIACSRDVDRLLPGWTLTAELQEELATYP